MAHNIIHSHFLGITNIRIPWLLFFILKQLGDFFNVRETGNCSLPEEKNKTSFL